jgi:hypothetical protein
MLVSANAGTETIAARQVVASKVLRMNVLLWSEPDGRPELPTRRNRRSAALEESQATHFDRKKWNAGQSGGS